MSYTLSEAVHVDIVLDGVAQAFDFKAGDNDIPEAVATVLVAQGFATETVASKKSKTADSAPADSTDTQEA